MSTRLEAALQLQALLAVNVDSEMKKVREFERSVMAMSAGHCDASADIEKRIAVVRELQEQMLNAPPCTTITIGPITPIQLPDPVNYFEIDLALYRRSLTILALVKRLTSPEPRML